MVGTHALVQGTVHFKSLGLAIIDEQHRFGVVQRATLRSKGLMPDVLVMTATPIPRTLALTVYGDLDVSVIRDLPPGRRAIATAAKPESRRDDVYAAVREELNRGRQVYVVYPLIEESEKVDLKAATAMADHLSNEVFPEYRVALLHGRMKPDAKDRVMRAFASGDIHVLVSTTVIEVGIDVPNATMMVIEHAERFGLSQLHQLRGRVGRGAHQSHCILLYQYPISKQGKARLQALASTANGFEIAERDLELRGPGDFFGTRQSGLPTLRTGDLLRDHPLMERAREEAARFLREQPNTAPLVERMKAAWPGRFGLMDVG
jgi:ATP-dependent DNA helicase RecG